MSETGSIVQKHGFMDYRTYVARTGRSREISIFIVAPAENSKRSLLEWDILRDAIGGKGPDRWFTITFVSDLRWAE